MNTTNKEIAQNNKIIAEFIGLNSTNGCVRSETGKYYDYHASPKFSCIKEQEIQIESENGFGLVEQDFLFVEDLKFHSDWNWLMEVVEKIEETEIENNILMLESIGNEAKFIYDDGCRFLNSNIGETKIEAVYNACLEFIKYYNEQNKV